MTVIELPNLVLCTKFHHTRRYSDETGQHIIKLFTPSGSHTTLVFAVANIVAMCRCRPNGGVECRGVWKIAILRSISQKRCKIGL